jgi:heptosyltransferase-2
VKKFLIIQTAFIGDVILATSMIENLHSSYPHAQIDFMIREGNESLLVGHPYIRKLYIWNKRHKKYKNLWCIWRQIRQAHYDAVFNVQRYFATGWVTAFSNAAYTAGFSKNPLSIFFTKKMIHTVGTKQYPVHEVERNHLLLTDFVSEPPASVRLYPSKADYAQVLAFQQSPFVTISPASVWFTKQWPVEKWVELIENLPPELSVYLLGGPGDKILAESIVAAFPNRRVENFSGKLSLLASAALMKMAAMNYVNDSAPMHLASAMNAPVTAIYCSTVPWFGFGPRSVVSFVAETEQHLTCRPCGLTGKKACPQGHFKCAWTIDISSLVKNLNTI